MTSLYHALMIVDEDRPARRRYLVPIFVFGLIAFSFLYCCSGMQWPMLRPRNELERHLSVYPGSVPLPGSAKVLRAVRVAQNDSSEFYEVEMPAEDAEKWKQAFLDSVVGLKQTRPEKWYLGPKPEWFEPADPVRTTQLGLFGESETQGFRIYFTPDSQIVLVCWYET